MAALKPPPPVNLPLSVDLPSTTSDNPKPVFISDKNKHKVKVFLSPDYSIQPLVEFISSAMQSIDMYIPEWKTWTYPSNKFRLPEEWMEEENPMFRALVNAGVKKIKMRFLTHGPQMPNIPGSSDMWEWYIVQGAQVNFILPEVLTIGGIMMIVDGGEKILLTTMSGTPASFLYNRESTIILESKCEEIATLFQNTFEGDFIKGIPFLPTKEVILNTEAPLLDPAASTMMETFIFEPVSTREQPPSALVNSPIRPAPYIFDVAEVDDVEFKLAMAGPEQVEWQLLEAIESIQMTSEFVQISTRSLTNDKLVCAILQAYQQDATTYVNVSYTLEDKTEAKQSDANIQKLYNDGMYTNILRGPLYSQKPETNDYYTHNGQNYINMTTGLYFMTGTLLSDDLNKRRNFYVSFKSENLSDIMNDVFSGDQLNATAWDPSHKTAVGPEKKL